MIETRHDLGFLQESLDIRRAGNPFLQGNLDRHRAVEFVIVRQEDLAESTRSKSSENRVPPELRGVRKRLRYRQIPSRILEIPRWQTGPGLHPSFKSL